MKWSWRKPEVRESYTDQVVARIMASASGASDGRALAAIETASRIWGSGLASAAVTPSTLALRAVTPAILDSIGRSLCRSGESLHVIHVRNEHVRLTPCAQWTVKGDADPASWIYLCNMNGPSTATAITLPGASVVHVRYAPSPSQPWKGRSPMQMALDTTMAAFRLEKATSEELNFTQSQLIVPRKSAGEFGMADSLTPDTISKIVAAFAEHTHTGAFVIPADVTPQRLGPEPPDSFALLRDRLENSILAMHGIPPALIAARGTGTALRESFRQVLHSLLKPLGAILAEELKEKLDPAASIDFTASKAGDLTSSARAVGVLVTAGMTLADAREVVGI